MVGFIFTFLKKSFSNIVRIKKMEQQPKIRTPPPNRKTTDKAIAAVQLPSANTVIFWHLTWKIWSTSGHTSCHQDRMENLAWPFPLLVAITPPISSPCHFSSEHLSHSLCSHHLAWYLRDSRRRCSSSGGTNFSHSCVPSGTMPAIFSATTIPRI